MPQIRNTKRLVKRKSKIGVKIAIKKVRSSLSFLGVSCDIQSNHVEFSLPLYTVSEANGGYKTKSNGKCKSEHWTDKHKRHKKQKGMVALFIRPYRKELRLPCLITLTRYAPNKLDKFDNLPMSMKWILDACCEILTGDYRPGRADDNDQIDVKYDQVASDKYGVKIKFTFVSSSPARSA